MIRGDRPALSGDAVQALSTALVLDRLSLIEAHAIARRKRRSEAVGNEKAEKFYSRVINELGVGLD